MVEALQNYYPATFNHYAGQYEARGWHELIPYAEACPQITDWHDTLLLYQMSQAYAHGINMGQDALAISPVEIAQGVNDDIEDEIDD